MGFKTVLIFQEWHLSFKLDKLHNLNSYLFDKYLGYFVDGIFPISEFILQKCIKYRKSLLKVPIAADYTNITSPSETHSNYFLYCASAGYFRIAAFILNSFSLIHTKYTDVKLVLVLSGEKEKIDRIRNKVHSLNLDSRVDIYSKLPYCKLLKYYSNSLALLIPLNPESLQDKARFSQKIAEYLSSSRPIITNNVGEIPCYFSNNFNAFIAEDFTETSYSKLMEITIKNNELATRVGKNGLLLGKEKFDYKKIAQDIHLFLLSL